jgi:hypothetical protein
MQHGDDYVTREMFTGFFVALAVGFSVIATGLLLDWSNGTIGGVIMVTVGPAILLVENHFEKLRRRPTPRR